MSLWHHLAPLVMFYVYVLNCPWDNPKISTASHKGRSRGCRPEEFRGKGFDFFPSGEAPDLQQTGRNICASPANLKQWALNCTNNGNSRKLGQNHIHASEDCIQNHCKTQRKVCSLAPWNPPESGTWTDVHFCACNASDFNCENSVFRAQFARIWAGPHVPIILCTEVALSELWFPCSSTHLWQRVELVMGSVFLMFWICTPLLKRFYQKKTRKQSGFQITFYSILFYFLVSYCLLMFLWADLF